MKRALAASLVTMAAVAALAGCSISASSPMLANASKCSELTSSVAGAVDGAKLTTDNALGDQAATCRWTTADGGSVTVQVPASEESGVELKVGDGAHKKIEKDSTQTIIANSAAEADDGVLYSARGSEGSRERTFTAEGTVAGTFTLTTADLALGDSGASSIVTKLLADSA